MRLKEFRKKARLTQAEVAELVGVNQNTYSYWENEKTKIDNATLSKLADYFNVSVDELLGRDTSKMLAENFEIVDMGEMKKIPVVGSVKCGPNGLAFEDFDGDIAVQAKFNGDVFALKCKGDSMSGIGIFEGDIAIIRKQEDVECGELAVVIVDNEEGTLKRVKKKDSVIMLESANVNYSARVFINEDLHRVKIIGKVIQVIKQF